MAWESSIKLSEYIVSLAAAARAAQVVLSSNEDPMTIMEYTFDVELKSSLDVKRETEATLNIWRLTLTETLAVDMKNASSLTIGCRIAPTVMLGKE
jgi:hypothetical protein